MKIKTIQELNERIWYRFIKVAYLLFFVLIILCVGIFTNEEYGRPEFNTAKYSVKCNNGKTLDNETLKKNGVFLLNSSISSSNDSAIKFACDPNYYTLKGQSFNFETMSNYIFIPAYTPENWIKKIGYFIGFMFIVIFLFELFRRIFYYIVFGKISPQKHNESNNPS